ncbi:MAG: PA14 domain-containing protein [Planctomycetota bacterium]|jgi:hypothetical protein|nr:PA14 domain-containing protein [Planctomycetota bacterium]
MNRTLIPMLVLTLVVATGAGCPAVEYGFPEDANIIDVKRDFGATGDGVSDDTKALKQAIQTALRGDYRNPKMIFLPAGNYLISETLSARITDGPEDGSLWCNGWRSGLILIGQHRDQTIITLQDRCPGFGNPEKPRPMLVNGSTGHGKGHDRRVGGWGNEAFQNYFINFTVDTGAGNPGAVGIDFLASNRGAVEEVTIRSGAADGSGVCGLDQTRAWPGPGLITNVAIIGFDYGIKQQSYDCSMTYEHITLLDQKRAGVGGFGHPFMSFRDLTVRGAAPAFVLTRADNGTLAVLDSHFQHTGDAPTAAIVGTTNLLLKNVHVDGHPVVVQATGNKDAPGATRLAMETGTGTIARYTAKQPTRLFPGPTDTPDLTVKDTPVFHHTDFSKWAKPQDYAIGSTSAGIQEAIDSGAEIVYLPNGNYTIEDTIVLRGSLRKIIGCEAQVHGPKTGSPTFRFDGVASGTVLIEHIGGKGSVLHNCDQTLVLRKCHLAYRNSARGTGDAFLEDGMFGFPDGRGVTIDYPQNLWGRQVNAEYSGPAEFSNRHGTAWILGLKTEGGSPAIVNSGGITECYGLYSMTGHDVPNAFVINNEGWLAVALRDGGQRSYKNRVKDTWGGETRTLGGSREINLSLCGQRFDPQDHAPDAPTDLKANAEAHNAVRLSWTAPTPGPFPLAYYLILRDRKPWSGVEATATEFVDTEVTEQTRYAYSVLAVDLRGGRSPATRPLSVTTPADTQNPSVNALFTWDSDPSVLILDLNEPLTDAATDPSHYTLEPAIAVTSARLGPAGNRVILQLATALPDGQQSALICRGLRDRSLAGNALDAAAMPFTSWRKGDGLKAEFWPRFKAFDGDPELSRIDSRVEFWWGGGSPGKGIGNDDFTCRWSGTLRPKHDGKHRFHLRVAGFKRLTLDGKVIIDRWDNAGGEESTSAEIELRAGQRYPVVIETAHADGGAGVRFYWNQPGVTAGKQFNIERDVVTPEYLFPTP